MEADGVPAGYDRWRKIGVVRHPVERLWSLYGYLTAMSDEYGKAYAASMRRSVAMPFDDWIVDNKTVFTNAYDTEGTLKFWPLYNVLHSLPENMKSQFLYLRPDLGTEIHRYDELETLAEKLDIRMPHLNVSVGNAAIPPLSKKAQSHCERYFEWDFRMVDGGR